VRCPMAIGLANDEIRTNITVEPKDAAPKDGPKSSSDHH